MEYVYQIDPDTGERLGKVLRSRAHDENICHEVIHLWLINDKGEILLQYRAANKAQYASCYHMAVAGHIKYGESVVETVVAETKEEIDLDVDKSKLIKLFAFHEILKVPEDGSLDNEYRHVFAYKVDKDSEFSKLQSSEVESVAWMGLDELKQKLEQTDFYSKMLPHKLELYLKVIDMLIALE